jgi:AraC-like DNA-binding protein
LSAADHWYFLLLKSGSSWVASDSASDRAFHGRDGDIALYSLSEPFRAEISAAETLLLFVPRDAFSIGSEHLDRANNTILQSPLHGFLADYLMVLERHLPLVTYRDLPAIAAATRATIAACMIADKDSIAEGATGLAVCARERARRVVRARLGEPSLTPADVARAVGISRSALYRIFELQGGVAHYIQKCRLAAAHKALCNPEDLRHIRQIAEAVGFASPQEFSRAFRKAYGYSPSEARNEVGNMHGVALSDGQFDAAEGSRSLVEFLRSTT